MEKNIKLTIFPVELIPYDSAYTEKFKTSMFKETIRINNEICVYRHWETTQIAFESMPMVHFQV